MAYKETKHYETNKLNTPGRGVSWRAILAGTLSVIAAVFVLNMIGLAVGFGSINPTEEDNPLSGVGTGALIWWIVSHLIALFFGGWIAGRAGRSMSQNGGLIQGFLTWALYSLISIWLITSAIGSVISGVGNVVGNTLSTAGQAVGNVVEPAVQEATRDLDISLNDVRREIYALLEDTNKEELQPENLEQRAQRAGDDAQQVASNQRYGTVDAEIEAIFNRAGNRFEGTYQELDKEALANVIAERTELSQQEAMREVEMRQAQYENLRQDVERGLENLREEAERAADQATDAAAKAAMWLSITLILGALAGTFGGLTGANKLKHDYEHRVVKDRRVE